jgi:hypothetical protein
MTNSVEREFRDGVREVPDYIADYLTGVDTMRFTFMEAMELANKARVSEHLNKLQQKVITDHFKDIRSL